MVLTKWFILKSGVLQKKELGILLIIIGFLFLLPVFTWFFFNKLPLTSEDIWYILIPTIIGFFLIIGGLVGVSSSKKT